MSSFLAERERLRERLRERRLQKFGKVSTLPHALQKVDVEQTFEN